jgi:hypothetical protein
MRNKLVLLLLLSFIVVSNAHGQTALEKAMKRINVSINIPSVFSATQNEELMFVTKDSILPNIKQIYDFDPSYGSIALKVIFSMIHSIFTHKDGECVIFVYAPPGKGGGKYGEMITDSVVLYTLNNLSFGKIKHNFRYGKPMIDASESEAIELNSMLTHYPKEQSTKMFNANVMVMYPLNLRGNVYNDKYTRSRAVVVAKDRHEIYLYFLMTDKSVNNFDNYLNDLSKAFWFND